MTVTVSIHGAAGTVTGSCLHFHTAGGNFLVDCGMFQGPKSLKALNYREFPFSPGKLDAVLLTHAHIDHSGLIPKLVRAGFSGAIHATRGTIDLCDAMLRDAGHIQEMEVESLNRRNARRGRPAVTPIYTAADAAVAMRGFRQVEYDAWFEPVPGVRARYWNAGHILGSASIELAIDGEGKGGEPLKILLSGDVGPGNKALQRPAEGPAGLDYVFCESTYGGTDRPPITPEQRRARLAAMVREAATPDGVLLMPAFAVERTQELLADLVRLMESGEIPAAPIFVDSPLAIRATRIFMRAGAALSPDADLSGLLHSTHLRATETAEESRAIEEFPGFKIVLAGSGMCDAGRIRHHLRHWLWRPRATVLLTGFQAQGTLGRLLQDGASDVRIQGDEVTVRARIRWTDDYSGHADAPELAEWIAARQPIAAGLFLVHGEEAALAAFAGRVAAHHPLRPALDASYTLTASGAREMRDGLPRLAPGLVGRLDWHNARSRLILDISARLDAARDDAEREKILGRLRQSLDGVS
jgi:metallo-beta-lactamase family protein